MRKERKCYSLYNSFCEITEEPSSKFSTSLPLKTELYPGNFPIPIWIKSPVFVSTLTSERAIGNHILQHNQPLQIYFYRPVSINFLRKGQGMVQCWF